MKKKHDEIVEANNATNSNYIAPPIKITNIFFISMNFITYK